MRGGLLRGPPLAPAHNKLQPTRCTDARYCLKNSINGIFHYDRRTKAHSCSVFECSGFRYRIHRTFPAARRYARLGSAKARILAQSKPAAHPCAAAKLLLNREFSRNSLRVRYKRNSHEHHRGPAQSRRPRPRPRTATLRRERPRSRRFRRPPAALCYR